MTLSDYETRLKRHFARLRLDRSHAIGDKPLFALEHGLSEAEFGDMSRALQQHVSVEHPSSGLWLAWVVYAAEMGYRYEGDEYWQTFERRTPGWRFAYRSLIRGWFLKFRADFGGAQPVGAWAEHFKFICWPITHAVLPLDLQQQLARILWSMSSEFRSEEFESPELLGRQIAGRSWGTSPRFQILAQDSLLLGQIATALLLPNRPMFKHLLLPTTLERIARDLGKEAAGKRWLEEARRSAEGLTIRGLRRHGAGAGASGHEVPGSSSDIAPDLEPDLLLRENSAGLWDIGLEVPDFSSVVKRNPDLGPLLEGARCFVSGAPRPLARGRVLSERQTIVLKKWPDQDDVLLRFEPTTELLTALLATNCRLGPGPVWLFKLGADGSARWIRSRIVRPGTTYFILSPKKLEIGHTLGTEAAVDCEGIFGVRVSVPPVLDETTSAQFKELSLSVARHLHVRPVGLVPVAWDGEGRMECLSTDTISLALHFDHAPEYLEVALNDVPLPDLNLSALREGRPLYLQLGGLSVGLHRLTFVLRPTVTANAEHAYLELLIRDPRPWAPAVRGDRGAAFRIECDPIQPSFEEIWEARAFIAVVGPAGHSVALAIRFFERDGQPPILERRLPPQTLPVAARQLSRLLENCVDQDRSAEEAYDLARSCELVFRADRLGTLVLRAHRLSTPLRWVYGRGRTLRLVNDTGQPARVFLYSFTTPDKGLLIESDFTVANTAAISGGLYVADVGALSDLLIVPPVIAGLSSLLIDSRLEGHGTPQNQIKDLLTLFEQWHAARVTGEVRSGHMRREILNLIEIDLVRAVCGATWVDRERDYRSTGDIDILTSTLGDPENIRSQLGIELVGRRTELALTSAPDRISPFAVVLVKTITFETGTWTTDERGRARKTIPPRSEQPGWMAEFALRFASDPAGLRKWAGVDLGGGIRGLLKRAVIGRAARLVVLCLSQRAVGEQVLLTPEWQW